MTEKRTRKMVQAALIGALYTALTLIFAPFSFGTVQLRISETLVILPLFSPVGVWGVTFGCFISNLLGFLTGANPVGLADAFAGTLATFLAASVTCRIGRMPLPFSERRNRLIRILLAPLPAVVCNGLIVGLELALIFGSSGNFGKLFVFHAASVAVGEALVCCTAGYALCAVLFRGDLYRKFFGR